MTGVLQSKVLKNRIVEKASRRGNCKLLFFVRGQPLPVVWYHVLRACSSSWPFKIWQCAMRYFVIFEASDTRYHILYAVQLGFYETGVSVFLLFYCLV